MKDLIFSLILYFHILRVYFTMHLKIKYYFMQVKIMLRLFLSLFKRMNIVNSVP